MFVEELEEPPPIIEYIDKLDELEAQVERLERRIDELEAIIDEALAGEDGLRNIPEADEIARRKNDRNKKVDDRKAEMIEAEATFYTADCAGCIGITKSGYDVRQTIYSEEGRRVIAVDPTLIPLGSVVNIEMENGDEFEAKALDIGGDIKGARIDVLVESKSEAFRLGRQSAKIEIIKEGKR